MATKSVESTLIITSKLPRCTFQTSEQWHRSLPAKQQLQLTTRNLRDLGATLKMLNLPGQTPRASPSPSESSSDSESNHRIHRSTKKVCMREDMNTTREISPRPPRPGGIVTPELFDKAMMEWTKPDTPAHWHTSALSDALKEVGSIQRRTPETHSNPADVVIHLNGLSLSPLSSPTSAKWDLNATNAEVAHRMRKATRRFAQSTCGNGVGIYRRSHLALPRPQSLAKPRGFTFTGNPRPAHVLFASGILSAGNMKVDHSLKYSRSAKSTRMTSHPSSVGMSLNFKVDDPTVKAAGTAYCPSTFPQPSLIVHTASSDCLRQPRTYVDHVRAQRLPPNIMQSKTSLVEARGEFEAPQQRRMSV